MSSSPRLQLVTPGRVQAADRLSTYSEHPIDLDGATLQLADNTDRHSSPLSAEGLSVSIPIIPLLKTNKRGKEVAEPGIRQCMEEDLLQNIDLDEADTRYQDILHPQIQSRKDAVRCSSKAPAIGVETTTTKTKIKHCSHAHRVLLAHDTQQEHIKYE